MMNRKQKLILQETNDDCLFHQSPPLEENSSSSFVAAKKTDPREAFKDISNVESIGNVHISWKINLVSIISNLLKDAERTNFLVFKLIVRANRKTIFAKMDHHQITFIEQLKASMSV